MECRREARLEVLCSGSASYHACQRHVKMVVSWKKGFRVDKVDGAFACCWDVLSVGERLKLTLDALGWTQKRLAQVTGIPPQTISALVNDKKRLTPQTATKIGAALDFEPLAMLGTQADYELHEFDQEHPEAGNEVRVRLSVSEMTDDELVSKIAARDYSWGKANQGAGTRPLSVPGPASSQKQLFKEEEAEAQRRELIDRISAEYDRLCSQESE